MAEDGEVHHARRRRTGTAHLMMRALGDDDHGDDGGEGDGSTMTMNMVTVMAQRTMDDDGDLDDDDGYGLRG